MSFRSILYSSLLALETLAVVQGAKRSFRGKLSREERAAPLFNQSTYSFSPKNCSAGAYIGKVDAGGGDITYYLNNANNVQIDPQRGILKLWNDLYIMTVIVANARSSNGAVNSAPVTITPSCSYSSNSYNYGRSPYGYQPQPYAPYPYGPSYNPYGQGYPGPNANSGAYKQQQQRQYAQQWDDRGNCNFPGQRQRDSEHYFQNPKERPHGASVL